MTTMLPRILFRRCGAGQVHAIALLARTLALTLTFVLAASRADAGTAANPLSGVVSIADGTPFTIIRQSAVYSGSKGSMLLAGDIIETDPGALLVIGLTGGSLLGIGPSTQVYLLRRAEIPTVIVLRGWVRPTYGGAPRYRHCESSAP